MRKNVLALVLAAAAWCGCTTFSNLTPRQQTRNPDGLYPVEVAFHSRRQAIRWDSVQAYVNVGTEFYPMRPTPLMTNRWEGLVPVPRSTNLIYYRYKFDFKYNALGKPPQEDSALSPYYRLRILD
jgi:hypothetical protein